MTDSEREELEELRSAHYNSSLGDKPYSIAAHKLSRLIELEALASAALTELQRAVIEHDDDMQRLDRNRLREVD